MRKRLKGNQAFEVANILVDYARKEYPRDIAIIAVYGSQIRGTARPNSDIDMFYIPAAERGYKASFQFILNGVGYDFWPISWERAANMAGFNEAKTALIADSKVIYARTRKDLKRFKDLRAGIGAMRKPVYGPFMLMKAQREFRNSCSYMFNLGLPEVKRDLNAVRMESNKLVCSLTECWAKLNGRYLSCGWPQSRAEVLALKRKPMRAGKLLERAWGARNAGEICRACHELVRRTRTLIVGLQREYGRRQPYGAVAKGFYEELKSTLNKLLAACDARDPRTALGAAMAIQGDFAMLLVQAEGKGELMDLNTKPEIEGVYRRLKLPDLLKAYDPKNLKPLRAAAVKLDRIFKRHLEARGVKLREFDSLEQLREHLA